MINNNNNDRQLLSTYYVPAISPTHFIYNHLPENFQFLAGGRASCLGHTIGVCGSWDLSQLRGLSCRAGSGAELGYAGEKLRGRCRKN